MGLCVYSHPGKYSDNQLLGIQCWIPLKERSEMGSRDNSPLCRPQSVQSALPHTVGCTRVTTAGPTDWEGLGGSSRHFSSPSFVTQAAGRRRVCCQVASNQSFARTTLPGGERKNKLDPSPGGFVVGDGTMYIAENRETRSRSDSHNKAGAESQVLARVS